MPRGSVGAPGVASIGYSGGAPEYTRTGAAQVISPASVVDVCKVAGSGGVPEILTDRKLNSS